jgi:hypothetical protein
VLPASIIQVLRSECEVPTELIVAAEATNTSAEFMQGVLKAFEQVEKPGKAGIMLRSLAALLIKQAECIGVN